MFSKQPLIDFQMSGYASLKASWTSADIFIWAIGRQRLGVRIKTDKESACLPISCVHWTPEAPEPMIATFLPLNASASSPSGHKPVWCMIPL